MTSISSRAFNQRPGDAKKLSLSAPVIITDRGKPTHVLLSFADYERMTGPRPSIAEALGSDDDIDLLVPVRQKSGLRVPKFSETDDI